MPFKSQQQAKFLASKHPSIFRKWMGEYHQKISKLPKKVNKSK